MPCTPNSRRRHLEICGFDLSRFLSLWVEFPPDKGRSPNFSTRDSSFRGFLLYEWIGRTLETYISRPQYLCGMCVCRRTDGRTDRRTGSSRSSRPGDRHCAKSIAYDTASRAHYVTLLLHSRRRHAAACRTVRRYVTAARIGRAPGGVAHRLCRARVRASGSPVPACGRRCGRSAWRAPPRPWSAADRVANVCASARHLTSMCLSSGRWHVPCTMASQTCSRASLRAIRIAEMSRPCRSLGQAAARDEAVSSVSAQGVEPYPKGALRGDWLGVIG